MAIQAQSITLSPPFRKYLDEAKKVDAFFDYFECMLIADFVIYLSTNCPMDYGKLRVFMHHLTIFRLWDRSVSIFQSSCCKVRLCDGIHIDVGIDYSDHTVGSLRSEITLSSKQESSRTNKNYTIHGYDCEEACFFRIASLLACWTWSKIRNLPQKASLSLELQFWKLDSRYWDFPPKRQKVPCWGIPLHCQGLVWSGSIINLILEGF